MFSFHQWAVSGSTISDAKIRLTIWDERWVYLDFEQVLGQGVDFFVD